MELIKEIQTGFISPDIEPDHYIFGSGQLTGEVLQPNGQWNTFLPDYEFQLVNGVDPENCTGFGVCNGVEILMRRKMDIPAEYSDRFLGIAAGTYPPGNDPHTVCETARKSGFINDSLLSFDTSVKSIDKYYSPKPLPENLIGEGKKWLKKWAFKHDWVSINTPPTPAVIKEALKYSPLGVAVYAWAFDSSTNKYVRPKGFEKYDTHWCTLVGYVDNDYWIIFDSYDNNIKHLAWNFGFNFIKRYAIETQLTEEQTNYFMMLINKIRDGIIALWRK